MLLEKVACDINNTFCIGICRILDEHLRNLMNLDVFIQFVVRNKQLNMSFGILPIPYNQVVTRLVQANCVPESIHQKALVLKWNGKDSKRQLIKQLLNPRM